VLAKDHSALDKLLKTLFAALDNAETAAVFERLDFFWARLAMHIRAENLHLFPAILSRLEEVPQANQFLLTATREAIAQLRADHDFFMHELAAAIKAMRRLKANGHSESESHTMDEVRASITAITRRLESHNQIEEELVYGLPAKVLTLSEQRTLTAGIERELQNLPPRFESTPAGDR
jgi:hemerythrin-like domain-containing protein